MQQLIQGWAESKGYRVAIEKSILDGLGSVDVALERDDGSIASAISVTTGVEHDGEHIQKCLPAGLEHVVLVSSGKAGFKAAREAVSATLSAGLMSQVRFLPRRNCSRSSDDGGKGWRQTGVCS